MCSGHVLGIGEIAGRGSFENEGVSGFKVRFSTFICILGYCLLVFHLIICLSIYLFTNSFIHLILQE